MGKRFVSICYAKLMSIFSGFFPRSETKNLLCKLRGQCNDFPFKIKRTAKAKVPIVLVKTLAKLLRALSATEPRN